MFIIAQWHKLSDLGSPIIFYQKATTPGKADIIIQHWKKFGVQTAHFTHCTSLDEVKHYIQKQYSLQCFELSPFPIP